MEIDNNNNTTPTEKQAIDISGDGGVMKEILKEGTGEVPPKGATVYVHYVGTLLDGTKFDSSRDRDEEFEFVLGENSVIKGWELGVATMKEGETAVLTCAPEYAYGAAGSPPKIPANATLKFEVELVSFTTQREKKEWEMTAEEKIEAAVKKKDEGNALFKEKEFAKAKSLYDKAVDLLERGSYGLTEEEKTKMDAVLVVCLLNTAACSIQLKEYTTAVTKCTKALNLDPNNVKALYRRGQSYSANGDFDLASKDLKQAESFAPADKAIRNELALLAQRQQQHKQKEKKMFANLFSKLSQEDESSKPKTTYTKAADSNTENTNA